MTIPSAVIKVLAIDPSLRNWGLSKLVVDPATSTFRVLEMKLVKTESEAGKTVRKSSDDLRRAGLSYAEAYAWAGWADMLIAEVPSGSQSSRASLGAGMSIGLLAALAHHRPLIQVSPIDAKRAAVGRKVASKDEMIAWAMKHYPDAGWLTRKVKGEVVPVDANEHLADSLAIAEAGIRTVEFRSAVSITLSVKASASHVDAALLRA